MGNNPKTTIYYVVGGLDKKGFSYRVEPIDCEETNKTYVSYNGRINKNKMMVIDSSILDNHKWQHFYTYCLDGQQQDALDMIKNHIIKNVKKIKSEIDELYKWL